MSLRNRLSKFKGVIVENVPNNNPYIMFKAPGHDYIKLRMENGNAMLILNVNNSKKTINYAAGATNARLRGRGYGMFLRAIPIRAAKNSGYKKITHTASFTNASQRIKYHGSQPPSMRLVRFLGFQPHQHMKMVSELNLNKVDMNRINRIIRGNYTTNEYTRIVGPRK